MVKVDDETYEAHKGHRILTGAVLGDSIYCDTCGVWLVSSARFMSSRAK